MGDSFRDSPSRTIMRTAIVLFAIIAATALQVSASDAKKNATLYDLLNERSVAIKRKIDADTNALLTWIEEKVKTAKDGADEFLNVIIKRMEKETNVLEVKAESVLNNIVDYVDKIVKNSPGINVDECIDMATGIRNTTLKVIIDSALCVDQEIAKGSKQLGSISDNIDFVTKKLQEIKVEAAECFKDIHNLRTALNGYLCVQKAGKKVGYMATEQMPSLTTDSFKLGTKLSSVTISLKQCSTDKGLQTINESYNTVTASILNCVHHTMTNRMLEFEEHSYE